MSDPLARPLWRGRTNVDAMTIAAIEAAEEIAGFTFTVTQGSYQSSVPQSAGTHDKGGVIDWHTSTLSEQQKARMIAALREVGWAAWVRYPWQGDWPEHAHGVVIGHPYLADSAARQVTAYRNGLDGLAAGRDDYHPRPDPIPTFQWPQEDPMADYAGQLDRIEKKVTDLAAAEEERAKVLRKAVRQQAEAIRGRLREESVDLDDVAADVDHLLELVSED